MFSNALYRRPLLRSSISATVSSASPFLRRQLPLSLSKIRRMPPAAARPNSSAAVAAGYKEDASKPAMLRFEDSLSRLPVPSLEETAARYIKSVHPLLSASEYEATKAAVTEFVAPGGIGETLQKKLLARAADPGCKNWLAEWWDDAAYLAYRDPVVPYVSYFYSYKDDKARKDPAVRAAAVVSAALEFKMQVDAGSLEPEYMRKAPISMDSYRWMFNACRIPAKPKDHPVKYDPAANTHFVAVRKNQFFKIVHEVDGQRLSAGELEQQFRRVYELANAQKVPPVGALTSENRDVWTEARQQLLDASPTNAASLETIQSASFVVCLDDTSPVTLEERAHQYWHGDGANRWYDKPCQFIINDNGTAGFMGEHSMMDGTPTLRLNDYINSAISQSLIPLSPSVRSHMPDPTSLTFELSSSPVVTSAIDAAQQAFRRVIGAHDLRVLRYEGYGKGLIKRFGCSPDAYVQMVIQLAYYRMFGVSRPTYESAATRKFQLGRTETCRSVSDASVAWVRAMSDPAIPAAEAIRLLRAALDAHVEYIVAASDGKGVDRHLFGLKKLLDAPADAVPAIYKDPAFAYSGKWFLSTSQLNSEHFNGYGWSQVVDDGFGIAYMVNEDNLQFNVASKKVGAERMAFWLQEAAGEMRDLLMTELKSQAKL